MLIVLNPYSLRFILRFIQYTQLAFTLYKLATGKITFDSRLVKITCHVFLSIQVVQIILLIIRMFNLYYS